MKLSTITWKAIDWDSVECPETGDIDHTASQIENHDLTKSIAKALDDTSYWGDDVPVLGHIVGWFSYCMIFLMAYVPVGLKNFVDQGLHALAGGKGNTDWQVKCESLRKKISERHYLEERGGKR